jgi:hypothetical protein
VFGSNGSDFFEQLRRELQEPPVELINRRGDISLPELRFVRVDPLWHERGLWRVFLGLWAFSKITWCSIRIITSWEYRKSKTRQQDLNRPWFPLTVPAPPEHNLVGIVD